jgi:lipopolysaccharide exporter
MKSLQLFKSGLWITYANFINRAFVLLSSVVLARLLLPSDFGVIATVYIFWSFFTLFIQSSAGTFILQKGIEDPKYVNTAYTISLAVGVGLALFMVATASTISHFFNEPALTGLLMAFSANLILASATYAYSAVMTRKMQYRELANISLANSIVRLLSTTVAALLGCSYWSFVIGDTASWLVHCALTYRYANYPFRLSLNPEVRKEVITFCAGAVGSSFGLYANFNLDNFSVSKLLGSLSLGYYNLAYQLTMAFVSVLNPVLEQLGMPVFAQLTDDRAQQEALHKVLQPIALLSAPISALMFLMLDPTLVTLVFGEKWVPMCAVFPGLLLFAYSRVINAPLYAMAVAKGRPDINAQVNLCVAPVAVLGFVIGAQQGGIVGVSIAVAIILGIGWTLSWWWWGCRNFHWPLERFLIPAIIPLLLVFPGTFLAYQLPLWWRPLACLLPYFIAVRIFLPGIFKTYQQSLKRIINQHV